MTKNQKNKNDTEEVVWDMFSRSGSIGHYLLYKKLHRDND